MKIISHRGNIRGNNPTNENRPSYIDSAIKLGYEVEVDVRFMDNEFWLGHDYNQYKINEKWMELRKNYLWFHCKDIDSALKFSIKKNFNFFCHTSDDYVLTSNGYIWVHDLNKTINDKCIIPLLSINDIDHYRNSTPHAVCTDYVNECLKKFE